MIQHKEHELKENENEEEAAERAAKYKNIGIGFAAKGSILTLSFHVKQQNVIKLYLCYNGQCIRFMAEDIKTVLPMLFNMEFGENADYIKREIVDGHIKALRDLLVDDDFSQFQRSYTN